MKHHLLLAPDGNRRYAVANGIPAEEAYRLGAKRIDEMIDWWREDGRIPTFSVGCITALNFRNRPGRQLRCLARAVLDSSLDIVRRVQGRTDLGVNVVGDLDLLFSYAEGSVVERAALSPRSNTEYAVNLLVAYDQDADLCDAIGRCSADGVPPTFDNIAERGLIPPVTLFVRPGYPGGWNKLSCWSPGIERAKLYATPRSVQDVGREEFIAIIDSYFDLKDSVQLKFGVVDP